MALGPIRVGAAVGRTCASAVVLAGLTVSLVACQAPSAPTPARSPVAAAPTTIPLGDGGVVGGLYACWATALPEPQKDKGFEAGTVTVLGGTIAEVPISGSAHRSLLPIDLVSAYRSVLPTDEVTSVQLVKAEGFRFLLPAGPYVLSARYPQGGGGWNFSVPVVVHAGRITKEDLLAPCI